MYGQQNIKIVDGIFEDLLLLCDKTCSPELKLD